MFFKKIIFIVLTVIVYGQNVLIADERSDKVKPRWVTHSLPQSQSGSYIFVRAHGEGTSLAGAKQIAFISMSQRLENERGFVVNSNVQAKEHFSQNQKSASNEYEQEITLEVIENGHQLKIVCREIDDYWVESLGKYEVDVLYTVTNKNVYGGSYDDNIIVTAKYPYAGFLSIIPGVGQIYKGTVAKGSFIITGEVLAIGGVALCENTRASYVKKMIEQPKYASEYNSLADTWETGRNICIGAAVAIYIYNLIDAFSSTGAKRVIVQKNHYSLSAVPYLDNNSVGLCFAIRF